MRWKLAFPLLTALGGLAACGGAAQAGHCGASKYPAVSCCPEQCCPPVVRYRVRYQTVVEEHSKICYRPVYTTVMKEWGAGTGRHSMRITSAAIPVASS